MLRTQDSKLDKWFRLYVNSQRKPAKYPNAIKEILKNVGEKGFKIIQSRYEEISHSEQIFGKKKGRAKK